MSELQEQPTQTISLDPVAAHFKRKADFFEQEAFSLSLALRDLAQTNAALAAEAADANPPNCEEPA